MNYDEKISFLLKNKIKNLANLVNVRIITKTPSRVYNSTRCFIVCPNICPVKNRVFGLYSFGAPSESRTPDTMIKSPPFGVVLALYVRAVRENRFAIALRERRATVIPNRSLKGFTRLVDGL